jgi:hypothetical protein
MRLLTVCLAMGLAPLASAHTLDGDASPLEEIAHQISSGHHLPLILLASIAAAVAIRVALGRHRR